MKLQHRYLNHYHLTLFLVDNLILLSDKGQPGSHAFFSEKKYSCRSRFQGTFIIKTFARNDQKSGHWKVIPYEMIIYLWFLSATPVILFSVCTSLAQIFNVHFPGSLASLPAAMSIDRGYC